MSWTKKQFIIQAFDELGIAAYVYDLQPEQLQTALRRLDSMMATWNALGIRISYPLPDSPDNSDIDAETAVPDRANEAVYTNLAIRLAPGMGKVVSMDTKLAAKAAYDNLLLAAVFPAEMVLPMTMPLGAGNKPNQQGSDNPFFPQIDPPIQAGQDSFLEI